MRRANNVRSHSTTVSKRGNFCPKRFFHATLRVPTSHKVFCQLSTARISALPAQNGGGLELAGKILDGAKWSSYNARANTARVERRMTVTKRMSRVEKALSWRNSKRGNRGTRWKKSLDAHIAKRSYLSNSIIA